MNTEKINKLKKGLSNSKISDDLKAKIQAEIDRLEKEDKSSPAPKETVVEVVETKPAVAKSTPKKKPVAKKAVAKKPMAKTETAPTEQAPEKQNIMLHAKKIRRSDETWKSAVSRASEELKAVTEKAEKASKSEMAKLLRLVRTRKDLKNFIGHTDIQRDAKRKALPQGKRTSKDGNTYYENRANRTDRSTIGRFHLAEGGVLDVPKKITESEAKKLFNEGMVIYVKDGAGKLETNHNVSMISPKATDMNIYSGLRTSDKWNFDVLLKWLRDKTTFPLEFYTLNSPEFYYLIDDKRDFADGGDINEVAEIYVSNYPYYLKKMGDTTHFKMANSKDGVDKVWGSHIGEHRSEDYYEDVRSWLKGGKSPNGNKYTSKEYADGGDFISSAESIKQSLEGKTQQERIDAITDRIKLHKWSDSPINKESGIVKTFSEIYNLEPERVASLFNKYQANYASGGDILELLVADGGEGIIDNTQTSRGIRIIKTPKSGLRGFLEKNDLLKTWTTFSPMHQNIDYFERKRGLNEQKNYEVGGVMNKKNKIKSIILSTYDHSVFAKNLPSFDKANQVIYFVWKSGKYSNVRYKLEYENGETIEGIIDIEPKDFHASHKNTILSWHLKTYWGNVAKSEPLPYLPKEYIAEAKELVDNYEFTDEEKSFADGGSINDDDYRFVKTMNAQLNHIISLKTVAEKIEPIQNILNNIEDYAGSDIQKRITADNLKYALKQKTVANINKVLKTSMSALKFEDGGSVHSIIHLVPLELVPLSSQLSKITGDALTTGDYTDENGNEYSTAEDAIIVHKKSGQKFRLPEKIWCYVDGLHLVIPKSGKTIKVFETNQKVADIVDGNLDFTNKDEAVSIDKIKVKQAYEKGHIPSSENATREYIKLENELHKQYALYEDVEDDKESPEAKSINDKIKQLEGLLYKLNHNVYADGGQFEKPYDVVYKTKSGRGMIANRIMATSADEAKEKLKKQMQASSSFDTIITAYESFADGGSILMNSMYKKGGLLSPVERYKEELKGLTGLSKTAINDFIVDYNISESELLNLVIGLGRKQISRADVVTAIVGDKGNSYMADVLAFAKSDTALKAEEGIDLTDDEHDVSKAELGANLAGWNGTSFGIGTPQTTLDGFTGTAYSSLVGETNAMSAGELFEDGGNVNQKKYSIINNVGKSKYVVNFYDGEKKHKDGSAFYDIRIFKNKKDLGAFEKQLLNDGYIYKYADGGRVDVNKHTYMMLSRLQMDNDYFLGFGGRSERNLWAGTVDEQISEMKKLWNQLPKDKKPEWLSMEDILEYERKMKKEYAEGGSIPNNYEGRMAEDVWNDWTIEQRSHFLLDHSELLDKDRYENNLGYTRIVQKDKNYSDLTPLTQRILQAHVRSGQYAKGGDLENYPKIKSKIHKND